MTDIILNGCNGKMGVAVTKAVSERNDCRIVAGVDLYGDSSEYKVYRSFDDVDVKADVIIDFSNPIVLDSMLRFAKSNNTPVVICTTGFSQPQVECIKKASEDIAVFYSGNMSLGIALLIELARTVALTMPEAEIEIVEAHHNRKIDAPSGTALMIADAITAVRPETFAHAGRSGQGKREKNEIGIHSLRMGNVVGIHEVIVATENQTITLKHEAHNRALFAEGALAAAEFLCGKGAGLYTMDDIVANGK